MAPGERYCRCPGCGECSASISAREATVTIKRLLDALHATHSPPWTLDNCPSCRKVLAP